MSAPTMPFRISTPTELVVDTDAASYVQAEDATGRFGILPHHATFLTVLVPSVVTWREPGGVEHFVAVRGGIFEVTWPGGVNIVSREAFANDDLEVLRRSVLARSHAEIEAEQREHLHATRLHLAFMRQVNRYLRGGDGNGRHGDMAARLTGEPESL